VNEACACGAPWREGARFCGKCGRSREGGAAQDEERVAVGPRGLGAALTAYFACLVAIIALALLANIGTTELLWAHGWFLIVGVVGASWVGRDAWGLLRLPSLSLRGVALALVGTGLVWCVAVGLGELLPSLYVDETALYKSEGKGLGYALTGLRGVFRQRTAIIVSGLMFATIHLSVISFFDHALLGMILAAVCVRTRSVWPGVFLHAAWNAGVVLLHW
jgi:hypothetical protein